MLAFFSSTAVVTAQNSLDQGIATLSEIISKQLVENRKKKIVVLPFSTRDGRVSGLGSFLADELIARLIPVKRFVVVERQQLDAVIKENNLKNENADEHFKTILSSKLKVDAIVLGTITEFAQSVRINARVISVDTGEILAAASTEIGKDDSVVRLMGQPSPSVRQSYSDDPSIERIQIGNNKNGTIIEEQYKDYKFDGVANSPLLFTLRAGEGNPRWARYTAGIYDSRTRKLKEPIGIISGHVQELPFTPPIDGQYIIRLRGERGRVRFTIYLDRP